eukprot:3247230-Rhodomonas_salina.1
MPRQLAVAFSHSLRSPRMALQRLHPHPPPTHPFKTNFRLHPFARTDVSLSLSPHVQISRRQESIRFASQTARLHSRPTSAVSTASRALSSARPMSSRPTSSRPTSSRPASSRPASSRPMSARFISGTAAGMDTDFDSEEEEEEVRACVAPLPALACRWRRVCVWLSGWVALS